MHLLPHNTCGAAYIYAIFSKRFDAGLVYENAVGLHHVHAIMQTGTACVHTHFSLMRTTEFVLSASILDK